LTVLGVVAVEVLRFIDEEHGNRRAWQNGALKLPFDNSIANGDTEDDPGRLDVVPTLADGAIKGQDNGAINVAASQGCRESAGDIGQAARLGKAHHFGSGQQNADGINSSDGNGSRTQKLF